jgi:hypothetical protein
MDEHSAQGRTHLGRKEQAGEDEEKHRLARHHMQQNQ